MHMAKARVGIIGAGWWATHAHLPSLTSYADADVVGVADLDGERARITADAFDVSNAFADHLELLALEPDAVIVVTPHHTHYRLVKDALLAGADVMVEKPMVLDPVEARELVDLAASLRRNLHIGYPFPFTRHSQLLRSLIEAGELGDILLTSTMFGTIVHDFYQGNTDIFGEIHQGALWAPGTETYSKVDKGGGQLYTQVTHAASHVFFLTGLQPTRVAAFQGARDTEVDEWDAISFQTQSGAAGTVASTGSIGRGAHTVEGSTIFGSKGHAQIDIHSGTLDLTLYDGRTFLEPPLEPHEIYPLHATARQLVDTFLGRSPAVATGELGALTVEFLDAARRSAQSGQVVGM
jgi:predicted dehydrogenase